MLIRIGGLKVGGSWVGIAAGCLFFLKIAERLSYGNLGADV